MPPAIATVCHLAGQFAQKAATFAIRQTTVRLVYYIKVAKQEVLPPLPPEPAEKLAVYRKKYCPRDSWLISGHSEADRFSSDVENVNAWHQSASPSALIATASQSLTGFQDLAGSSVGQTTGTNAAVHGW